VLLLLLRRPARKITTAAPAATMRASAAGCLSGAVACTVLDRWLRVLWLRLLLLLLLGLRQSREPVAGERRVVVTTG